MGKWILLGLIWEIIAIFAFKSEKFLLNPITLLCGLWGMIDILSALCLYTLYAAKDSTYLYINAGLLAFCVGYFLLKIIAENRKANWGIGSRIGYVKKHILRERVCYGLILLCFIFIGLKLKNFKNVFFANGFSLGAIQSALQEGNTSFSGILNAINFLIINPLFVALPAAIIADYFVRRKNNKLLLCSVVLCFGRIIISGGRQAFIQLFFYIFIGISFAPKAIRQGLHEKLKRFKGKRTILFSGIVAVVVLLLLTMSRTAHVFKTIYLDFAMQPIMFEIWSDKLIKDSSYAFGASSLMGIIYPICYIIKNLLGLGSIPGGILDVYNMYLSTMAEWVKIGRNLSANAYVTCFWYFFYDARILGILLEMFIWGILSGYLYLKVKKNPTSKKVCIYMFNAMALFYTFGDFYPANPYFILGLFYACGLFRSASIKQSFQSFKRKK